MRERILVCGATGFMGRNLYEYFSSRDYKVHGTCWETKPFDKSLWHVNLCDATAVDDLLLAVQPDVVIQAAATTSGIKDILGKPYIHVTDNAVMNSLLLRSSFQHKVKHFIFLSCGVMYQPSAIPLKETDWKLGDQIIPQYFGVGSTKVYIEQMCEFYSRLGMKTTAVRHSNTYGPFDKFDPDHSHVMGATIRKVMENQLGIEVWGTGEEKKDLIYVEDVVRAIHVLIDRQEKSFERVNVSSGFGISINDLVDLVMKIAGKKLQVLHNLEKPTSPVHFVYDNTYMTQAYGWVPRVMLPEGIERTIEWFKVNYKGDVQHSRFN